MFVFHITEMISQCQIFSAGSVDLIWLLQFKISSFPTLSFPSQHVP